MSNESFDKKSLYIYLLLLGVFGYVMKYILNTILSHHLTTWSYGDFSIALKILALTSSLALLGTNTTTVRFISTYLQDKRTLKLKSFIEWNVKLVRYSFCICILVGGLSVAIMSILHVWNWKDIQTYHLSIYMLWVTPVASTFMLLSSYLLCAQYYVLNAFMQNAKSILTILLFFVIIIVLEVPINDYSLGLILLLVYVAFIVIELFFIIYKMPLIGKLIFDSLGSKNHASINQDWFRVSRRLALNGVICAFIFSCDLIIIQLIDPITHDVGLYAVALTIASSLFVIPQNIYSLLKSQVSTSTESVEGKNALEQHIKHLNRISYLFTLILASVLILFSKQFLGHFGFIYQQAGKALIILIVGFSIGATCQPATAILAYSGHETTLLKITIMEFILIIVSAIIATYFWGYVGTAVATSLTIAAKALLFHTAAYRKVGVRTFII